MRNNPPVSFDKSDNSSNPNSAISICFPLLCTFIASNKAEIPKRKKRLLPVAPIYDTDSTCKG